MDDETVRGRAGGNGRGWGQRLASIVLVVVLAGAMGLLGAGQGGGRESAAPSAPTTPAALHTDDAAMPAGPSGAAFGFGATPTPEANLVADIYRWLVSAYDFLTNRHTCSGLVENLTHDTFTWVTDDAKSEDSWTNNPARVVPPFDDVWFHAGGLTYWTTTSGWMRGCWNSVRYQGPRGAVTVGLSDPWSGANDYFCRVEGVGGKPAPFWCIPNGTYLGRWSGDHLVATYCLVENEVTVNHCNDW